MTDQLSSDMVITNTYSVMIFPKCLYLQPTGNSPTVLTVTSIARYIRKLQEYTITGCLNQHTSETAQLIFRSSTHTVVEHVVYDSEHYPTSPVSYGLLKATYYIGTS